MSLDGNHLRAFTGKNVTLTLSDRCAERHVTGRLTKVSVTGALARVGRLEIPVEDILEADFGPPIGRLR